jgi:hypothetical protein
MILLLIIVGLLVFLLHDGGLFKIIIGFFAVIGIYKFLVVNFPSTQGGFLSIMGTTFSLAAVITAAIILFGSD